MPRAHKGSKLHMQDAVLGRQQALGDALKDSLPALRGRNLTWVSPLPSHDFAEFKDGAFLDALGLGSHRSALLEFWPSGGPNWDALARVDGPEGGVVLVEAKAHPGETPTPDRSGAVHPVSRARIAASLLRARAHLGVPERTPPWSEHHYQVANRLAHLHWLHVERRVPTWLVFLGFTGPRAWPTGGLTPEVWRAQVAGWMTKLGVRAGHTLEDRIGVAVMVA